MKYKRETGSDGFEQHVKETITNMFPGCIILKNDPQYLQGIPDLSIFYGDRWAMLEVKRSEDESHRPNQDYYVDYLSRMGFAAFIFPENEDIVLQELTKYFNHYC